MNKNSARRLVRGVFCSALVALAIAASPQVSQAHAGNESYVYLNVAETDLRGQVEMPYSDLREVLGLDLTGDDAAIRAELEAQLPELQSYAESHLSIGTASTTWALDFDGLETLKEFYDVADGEYAILPFVVDLGGIEVPQTLDVTFDPFFDQIEGRSGLLLIANDWKRGVFDNEAEALVQFNAASRTRTVDLGATSQWKNFSQSVTLGLDHIKTGPDHIFFVLVLLLPSVLVFSLAKWSPTATFGSALWRVLKIVSMFTIAHSITFTLAGLDILPLPPSKVVEAIIAASIAAAALHNLKPIGANKEWAIAFAFGLFHGMGFASLVSDLEVSKTTQLVSLLGRNVGIEIGQSVVVLLVFPGLFLLRRTVWYRPFFLIGSVVMAFVSLGWMIERIFEVDLGTSSIVDKVVQYPRVLLPVAVFTALCAAIHWWERSKDRLIDVHGSAAPVAVDEVDEPALQVQ